MKKRASKGEALDAATVKLLRTEVSSHGVRAVSQRIRVSRDTIARALAGLDILRGSAAMIREGYK